MKIHKAFCLQNQTEAMAFLGHNQHFKNSYLEDYGLHNLLRLPKIQNFLHQNIFQEIRFYKDGIQLVSGIYDVAINIFIIKELEHNSYMLITKLACNQQIGKIQMDDFVLLNINLFTSDEPIDIDIHEFEFIMPEAK